MNFWKIFQSSYGLRGRISLWSLIFKLVPSCALRDLRVCMHTAYCVSAWLLGAHAYCALRVGVTSGCACVLRDFGCARILIREACLSLWSVSQPTRPERRARNSGNCLSGRSKLANVCVRWYQRFKFVELYWTTYIRNPYIFDWYKKMIFWLASILASQSESLLFCSTRSTRQSKCVLFKARERYHGSRSSNL